MAVPKIDIPNCILQIGAYGITILFTFVNVAGTGP